MLAAACLAHLRGRLARGQHWWPSKAPVRPAGGCSCFLRLLSGHRFGDNSRLYAVLHVFRCPCGGRAVG
ncbi:hypothetical protein BDW62DRAFT_193473 [Aspergillus aurantiobrunneus]